MSQRVILDGLWCGQGMANMVRVFKSEFTDPKTNPSDWLCVFDFGSGGLSESKKELGITPPVRFMMEQLKLQQKAGRTPQIDLLLISHQDRDHWQLLRELNEQIELEKMTVIVARMILGGANWRQSSTDAVMKFYNRVPDPKNNVNWYDSEYSAYYDPKQPVRTLSIGDLKLSLLVTNVAANDTSDDIERNCSSAVVLLTLPSLFGYGYGFILPGDSTWETFERLKVIMEQWPTKPLPFIYAASVPHHGALRTMNRNNSVVAPDLQDLIWFTEYTRPSSVYASAGIHNTHSHPYRIVLETMGRYAGVDQFQKRPVVMFNGTTSKFEIEPDVNKNIYSTVLNLTSPAQTANWIFDITSIKNSTEIQLFEAGVPGILSAPELSEMELTAQRINAEGTKDVDMGNLLTNVAFVRGPVAWRPTFAAAVAPRTAATALVTTPELANRTPSVRAYHWPLATADAARIADRRAPPPRRVRAGASAGLSHSG
jgi:beta-lactamase superfamily II metal-dependent hydrolase